MTNSIERVTKRVSEGTYVFQVVPLPDNFETSMHYFQDYPEDYTTELTCIVRETYPTYLQAVQQMYKLFKLEKDKGFPGYKLTNPNIVRVKDLAGLYESYY